jgi:hypothetical protein
MRLFLFACSFILFSCKGKIDTVALSEKADQTRVDLMRKESDVSGNFFALRPFHQDMLQSTMSPEAAPYNSLDSLFQRMRLEADAVIKERLTYDSSYYEVKKFTANSKKKKPSQEQSLLISKHGLLSSNCPAIQSEHAETYFKDREIYQNICLQSGVKRLGMADLAALTEIELTQWQDSLEQMGRMLAKQKVNLKERFPSQKGSDFFAAYAPVSNMEAKMKEFDSMIAQLQNSLSRFEEGNKQDFVYFGPNIRMRLEVQATDNLVSGLALAMTEFREMDAKFWGK